jgi:hypothetical protein
MKNRLNSGSIGRARRALLIGVPAVGLAVAMVGVAPAQQALAQDIGDEIAATVAAAVSVIATHSGTGDTTASGGISTQTNTAEFGEDEGTALSDASGGSYNVSANPESGNGGDE